MEISSSARGVPLESSGVRVYTRVAVTIFMRRPSSLRSLAPASVDSLSGEYPMLLFHGPLVSTYCDRECTVKIYSAARDKKVFHF